MVKTKIAVSLDSSLLVQIDSCADKSVIKSRSQAIEFFLRKGLAESTVDKAVIFIKKEQQHVLLIKIQGESLLKKQISFFYKNGIRMFYIVTQQGAGINELLLEAEKSPLKVEIVQKEAKGNAEALLFVKDKICSNFVAMSGDTFNDFDLSHMIKKHLDADKIATMGLMGKDKPSKYGNAVLDGDLIVDFQEKPKTVSSNIVNAGIYVFKPEVFELLSSCQSLEKDLFPKLARIKQLCGFFTHGEYRHLG